MATHGQNPSFTTKVTVSDGSTISVDTINIQKDLPEDIISRFIPQYLPIEYDSIDPVTKTFNLVFEIHSKFLNHVNLLINQDYIKRFSSPNILLESQDTQGYSIALNNNAVIFSDALYNSLDSTSKIFLIYTPA